MERNKNQTILFDFDGTIADTIQRFTDIYNQFALKNNFTLVNDKNLQELRSKNTQEVIKTLHIPLRKLPYLTRNILKQIKTEVHRIQLFDGVKDVLENLKESGYQLGIISTNNVKNIRLFVDHHDIGYFHFIFSCKKIFGKYRGLLKAMKKFRLNKENIIYIADEIRDIDACRKAGIRIISVCWGFNSKAALSVKNADYLAEIPADILKYV